ncbi:BTB/POZ domain-containing protein 16-like [Symsagittifera roscoffensis]|uniref:BTB/POZ domain-containing protein 16-like n=1 Tax=Symsagittifera roscoffensis TaxID=84072 RepID=UPI00307C4931
MVFDPVKTKNRTQFYLHEATREGLQSGTLCNWGIQKTFVLDKEQCFQSGTYKDDNEKQHKFWVFDPKGPPQTPGPMSRYKRDVATAPYRALMPRAKNMKDIPQKPTIGWKNRIRSQVGHTNRWRLSTWLGTDLLGSSQAVRATVHIPSAEIFSKVDPLGYATEATDNDNLSKAASDEDDLYGVIDDDAASDVEAALTNEAEPELAFTGEGGEEPTRVETPGSSLPPISRQSKTANSSGRKTRALTETEREPKPVTVRSFTPLPTSAEDNSKPEFFLNCFGFDFELNYSVLIRSKFLHRLILGGGRTNAAGLKSAKRQFTKRQSMLMAHGLVKEVVRVNTFSQRCRDVHSMTREVSAVLLETLPRYTLTIPDNLGYKVTANGVAIALANLYLHSMTLTPVEAPEVFEAAKFLKFRHLKYTCIEIMMCNITVDNVGTFCQLSELHNINLLKNACIRWLAYHAVSEMSESLELKKISIKIMQEVLSHKHLFVSHEFNLYTMLCSWLYLQANKTTQMPPFGTIVTYFNSLPKWVSFLGRDETASSLYMPLFTLLRLHALTDPGQLELLQKMNVLPQNWLLNLVTMSYRSLQVGGDMSLVMAFETSAARYGLVVHDNFTRQIEVVSLHGFYFELSATPEQPIESRLSMTDGQGIGRREQVAPTTFYLQIKRLKPSDPSLSLGSKEKYTFSMRQDRELIYGITGQWFDSHSRQFCVAESTIKRQRFAFSAKMSKSEMLQITPGELPFKVQFALLFPPS